ncbi:glycosyltransferase family 2 protein [Aerosakkonemataceae cyanobacterium BLCC-F50]|uniref:Glycosyltransferase family 2 protein n=1 Tax=Floridaenema flaviceps BLCC-F50 TaxID=3153642 RepID=A0ABV4XWJ3_9CYAN
MNGQNSDRDPVPPVSEGVDRPLWSVMIPTYNCARFLRETLTSVLVQDPGSDIMQIEVIDDCSQDEPEKVVEEVAGSRVKFYRQPHNVGHTKNFQTCLERSRGKLIHLLHGDDCVREGFYRKMQQAFEQNSEIGAAFCRWMFIDENSHWQSITAMERPESGILSNWLERLAQMQTISTPSIVVRREVYEKLGGFDHRLAWVEDWEMWMRVAAHYPMWYEVEPLALYRVRANSNTGRYKRTGENIKDLRKAIPIVHSYLPEAKAKELGKKTRGNWAMIALFTANQMLIEENDVDGAIAQIREAIKCSQSFTVIKAALRLVVSVGVKKLQQTLQLKKVSIL